VERIGFLADEILSGCHPNAVRFVRYYITITQTRWHQACLRSEQRAVRLQEALRMARGSAALVEELLTWLMEAHALLTAKEKDAVPDDLTVVETLMREHLVSCQAYLRWFSAYTDALGYRLTFYVKHQTSINQSIKHNSIMR